MTRVCLVGEAAVNLRFELLSRETSRRALQTYDLRAPYENTVGLETVSLGSAVSLLNDLNWYIVRFVDEALVLEPSVSEDEWLSRALATAVRDDEITPAETGRLLKMYGIQRSGPGGSRDDGGPGSAAESATGDQHAGGSEEDPATETDPDGQSGSTTRDGPATVGDDSGPPRLVEPMLVTRTGDSIPEYDIRDVEDTLVVRVTEAEFENQ